MTTIPTLIEKLRGMKWPDRKVDAEIATAAAGYVYEKRNGDRKAWFYAPDGRRYQLYGCDSECLPRFTGSLDAVTELIERELPGAAIVINTFDVSRKPERVRICKVFLSDFAEAGHKGVSSTAATQPIALLIAFLEAKMEIGNDHT